MAKVRMIKTGLTMDGQVRRQGEVITLTPGMPLSIVDQKKNFKKGVWYVEVGSDEETAILAVGMPSERDAFSTDQVIKPGFAPADEIPENVVTEQVPVQPTDEEMEAEMVGDPEAIAKDSEVEDLSKLTRKELRTIIDKEGLEVDYDNKTNKKTLISGIEESRGE